MQNRVKVVICGKNYSLQTDESAAYVISLAKELDGRINAFMEENNASFPSAAVMTALALMDESAKSTCDVDNFRAQIKGYVEEAAAARIEAELGEPVTLVMTGGLARYVEPLCAHPHIYDPDVLLKGLTLLYERNAGRTCGETCKLLVAFLANIC